MKHLKVSCGEGLSIGTLRTLKDFEFICFQLWRNQCAGCRMLFLLVAHIWHKSHTNQPSRPGSGNHAWSFLPILESSVPVQCQCKQLHRSIADTLPGNPAAEWPMVKEAQFQIPYMVDEYEKILHRQPQGWLQPCGVVLNRSFRAEPFTKRG